MKREVLLGFLIILIILIIFNASVYSQGEDPPQSTIIVEDISGFYIMRNNNGIVTDKTYNINQIDCVQFSFSEDEPWAKVTHRIDLRKGGNWFNKTQDDIDWQGIDIIGNNTETATVRCFGNITQSGFVTLINISYTWNISDNQLHNESGGFLRIRNEIVTDTDYQDSYFNYIMKSIKIDNTVNNDNVSWYNNGQDRQMRLLEGNASGSIDESKVTCRPGWGCGNGGSYFDMYDRDTLKEVNMVIDPEGQTSGDKFELQAGLYPSATVSTRQHGGNLHPGTYHVEMWWDDAPPAELNNTLLLPCDPTSGSSCDPGDESSGMKTVRYKFTIIVNSNFMDSELRLRFNRSLGTTNDANIVMGTGTCATGNEIRLNGTAPIIDNTENSCGDAVWDITGNFVHWDSGGTQCTLNVDNITVDFFVEVCTEAEGIGWDIDVACNNARNKVVCWTDGTSEYVNDWNITIDFPLVSFISPTPANGSSQSNTDIYVNISSSDDSDHYTFLDFDNDVFLWMRMDDTNSSGDPTDLSSYSYNGSLIGDSFINSSGYFGNTSWFDGANDATDDYIQIVGTDGGDTRFNDSFSVSLWAKQIKQDETNTIIGTDSSSCNNGANEAHRGWVVRVNTAERIQICYHDGSGRGFANGPNSNLLTSNVWRHIVAVYNSSIPSLQVYHDAVAGTLSTTNIPTSGGANPLRNLRIGATDAFNQVWNGTIDEVILFNRSLTGAEVSALFNASANKYENNFTDLSVGEHIFTGYAVDIFGNKNQTEDRSVTIEQGPIEHNLTYDENGNLIQGFDKFMEYDTFNRLIKVNNSDGDLIAEYFYDHEGNRIKKVEYGESENTTTYYIDGSFIQIRITNGTSLNETYYYGAGKQLARKDNGDNKFFYHPDHLGSTDLVTNQSGDAVEDNVYLPFGGFHSGSEDSRFLYTGKEKDKDTGFYYYGERYYDPGFRHFVQPDSLIQDIYNPQDLNRYAYARNNPYKYTDPSGNAVNLVTGLIGAGIGGVLGGAISIGNQLASTGQVNWADVGKSTAVGAVAGGIGGLTFGLGTAALGAIGIGQSVLTTAGLSAVSGIAGGQAFQATSNVIAGQPITQNLLDPDAIVRDVAIGVATVGLFKGISSLGGGKPSGTTQTLTRFNLVQTSKGQFRLTGHALERMHERGITKQQIINAIEKGESKSFFDEGSGTNQIGYYNSGTKVFVPSTQDGNIPTVFTRSQRSFQNLRSPRTIEGTDAGEGGI